MAFKKSTWFFFESPLRICLPSQKRGFFNIFWLDRLTNLKASRSSIFKFWKMFSAMCRNPGLFMIFSIAVTLILLVFGNCQRVFFSEKFSFAYKNCDMRMIKSAFGFLSNELLDLPAGPDHALSMRSWQMPGELLSKKVYSSKNFEASVSS